MSRHLVRAAALAALLVPAAASAQATRSDTPSALALAQVTLPAEEPDIALAVAATPPPSVTGIATSTRLEAVRYRPGRRARYRRGPLLPMVSQFHMGFQHQQDGSSDGILFGFRGGPQLDPHVQVGLGVDWRHKEDRTTAVVSNQPLPGGGTAQVRQELSHSSSNLFPIMAFAQVSAGDELPVIPYFGVGGGYEVLFISADDYLTGQSFDGTFGGWGLQAWGGAAIPLSGRARINAEVFLNQAQLDRDVEDSLTGLTYRETVDMDGVGVRAGLSWGF